MRILVWDWSVFFDFLLSFAKYPLGGGFMNHLALVFVLVLVMVCVAQMASKFGTDEDAPFDLG